MRLSELQKYILLLCHDSSSSRFSRSGLNKFYEKIVVDKKPDTNLQTKIITRSIERLIDKELLVGFGERTKYKWFIKEIKLTAKGEKEAKKMLDKQMRLPLKLKKIIKPQKYE